MIFFRLSTAIDRLPVCCNTCMQTMHVAKTGQTVRESERDRKWKSSVYSAKDLFTLRWEEGGHPQVICAEQWAASAPEGIADPKIYSQKMHCKAQALPEHLAIRISLNRTAACATAMVTGEKARGRAGGHIIHNYLQQNSSYWFGWWPN